MKVIYNGSYPCLCTGRLLVRVGDKEYDFGRNALESGGNCDGDYGCRVKKGPWSIKENSVPAEFPRELMSKLIEEINLTIPHGCCGGCL